MGRNWLHRSLKSDESIVSIANYIVRLKLVEAYLRVDDESFRVPGDEDDAEDEDLVRRPSQIR